MSAEIIKYAFIAGELSPAFYGRTDLTNYDLAMAETRNWFVDYRGGLSTRPGTEFCDFIKHEDLETKFFDFIFSDDPGNVYGLLFGHNYVRFIQDGAYVLTAGQAVSAVTTADPGVFTSAGHGMTNGTWIKLSDMGPMGVLNGRSFEVANATTDTFTLIDPFMGNDVDTSALSAYTSGGSYDIIYELETPYASTDLADLSSFQARDLVRLTHPEFSIHNLKRIDHDDWTLEEEVIGNANPVPVVTSAVASGAGTAAVGYAVAAVMADGSEGRASIITPLSSIVNFTSTAGSVTVTWNPVAGAVSYVVYRTRVLATGTISRGDQLGYLGTTKATSFTDSNIIPDFTKAPYEHYDPFAQGAIEDAAVSNAGSGYSYSANITATGAGGTGSGFQAIAVANSAGALTNVIILNRGKGYVNPVAFSLSGGGGTGGAVTGTAGPLDGTFPSIASLFQQRQLYAASLQQPLTLWGSQIKRFSNFDASSLVLDNDSYEHEVDSAKVTPIRHMFSMRGGLLALSTTGVWLLTGSNGGAVTPTNALADPQSYGGVDRIRPLQIGPDLLYVEARGYAVRLLSYNDFSKVYSGEDQSILANHLFTPDHYLTRWVYAENPSKIVWGIRSDGSLISFTIVKEQKVFAWTTGSTRGQFKDILVLPEAFFDRVYFTVRRFINGKWHKYLERMAYRNFKNVEDAWGLDCALKTEPTYINATLQFSPFYTEGDKTYTDAVAGSSVFTGTAGHWIRAAGGIFIVDTVDSGTEAKLRVMATPTNAIPDDPQNRFFPVDANTWNMGAKNTTFSGLWHLEGEPVKCLGDGSVFPPLTVVNGSVTLPDGVSKAIVGIGYDCIAKTLPPTVPDLPIESKRKRIVGIGVRMHESRGLEMGRSLNELYEVKERTNEPYGSPTALQTKIKYQVLSTDWEEDVQTYFVQRNPLPITLLGLVPDLEVGDDTD